ELLGNALTPAQIDTLSSARSNAATMTSPFDGSVPPPSSSAPGQLVGPRYTLHEPLGAGGVGNVVAAQDREIKRIVALKTLQPQFGSDPIVSARFVEEARITAQLEHPGIIPIYDLGVAPDGEPFYTMRVVKRRNLREVLARRELRTQWPLFRLVNVL